MSEPINNHYLPVFYLQHWCNADGKVVRYYRPHREVVASPIAPANTGYEPRLYWLDGYPPAQRAWLEQHFMGPAVDDPASRAMRVLLEQKTPNPSDEVRSDWTRFIMSLALRDPATMKKNVFEAQQGLIAKLSEKPEEYQALRGPDDPFTFTEWVEINMPQVLPNIGKLFLPDFIENQELGTIIVRMRWAVFNLTRSGVTLLTSDRPCIRTQGLKDPHCVIVLPLSPHFAFVATHSVDVQRALLREGTVRLAKDINARIVANAIKQVYGISGSHLRFVENRFAPIDRRSPSR
jgi:hypothetical protein